MTGAVEGKEPWSWRKVREGRTHRNMHKNTSPKPLAGGVKGAEFCECFQPTGLKDWSFGSPWVWLGRRPEDATLLLGQRQANNPGADCAF